jgi:hypothetical protein
MPLFIERLSVLFNSNGDSLFGFIDTLKDTPLKSRPGEGLITKKYYDNLTDVPMFVQRRHCVD